MSDSRPSTLASFDGESVTAVEGLPHGEQRVGADVAEHHAEAPTARTVVVDPVEDPCRRVAPPIPAHFYQQAGHR